MKLSVDIPIGSRTSHKNVGRLSSKDTGAPGTLEGHGKLKIEMPGAQKPLDQKSPNFLCDVILP